jgi:hypothetical protein
VTAIVETDRVRLHADPTCGDFYLHDLTDPYSPPSWPTAAAAIHDLERCLAAIRATVAGQVDMRPHSRACGIRQHDHGTACHPNCPTCHGIG